jgi:methyl-accepting chemotaxis protein
VSTQNPPSGRFEQSFMFHMIRDFFLLALVVAGVELAIRYAALRQDFSRNEPERVDRAAQQLANDVRSIMLNSGGPTAAQTVYPILNRNYNDLGLSIAVEPSPVTVESMMLTRAMYPKGLPAAWPDGDNRAASVRLTAEQLCIGCHVKAQVGDVLGTVSVRSYLDRKESSWWQDVRLTAGALSLKILVHTVVLFLLLKVRMEPLLALRSTVSGLARGVMDLSPRASVKTEDEFGELAQDLNHFLDRISQLVRDLDRILSEVVVVGTRLGALNSHLETQLVGLRHSALNEGSASTPVGFEAQLLAAREAGAFDAVLVSLEQTFYAIAATGQLATAANPALSAPLARLRQSFDRVRAALDESVTTLASGRAQPAQYQAFAQSLHEMALLEAAMQKVAESGHQVLQRLTEGRHAVAGAAPSTAVQPALAAR